MSYLIDLIVIVFMVVVIEKIIERNFPIKEKLISVIEKVDFLKGLILIVFIITFVFQIYISNFVLKYISLFLSVYCFQIMLSMYSQKSAKDK